MRTRNQSHIMGLMIIHIRRGRQIAGRFQWRNFKLLNGSLVIISKIFSKENFCGMKNLHIQRNEFLVKI